MFGTRAVVIFTDLVPADMNPALPGMPDPFHRLEMWAFGIDYSQGLEREPDDFPLFLHHSVIKGRPSEFSTANSQTLRLLRGAWGKIWKDGEGAPEWTRTGDLSQEQSKILKDFEEFSGDVFFEQRSDIVSILDKSLGRDNFIGFSVSNEGGLDDPFGAEDLVLPGSAEVMMTHKKWSEVPE